LFAIDICCQLVRYLFNNIADSIGGDLIYFHAYDLEATAKHKHRNIQGNFIFGTLYSAKAKGN
jgi:hypothetical protein